MDQIPAGTFGWAAHLFAAVTIGTGAFVLFTVLRRPWNGIAALGVGMAAFSIVAVGEGLALLNGALLEPLHEAARFAGREAQRDGAPLGVFIGSPRRPSVFFYLPDGYVGSDRTLEMTDGEQNPGRLKSWFGDANEAVVISTPVRLQPLVKYAVDKPRFVFERAGWVVARCKEGPAVLGR